MNIKLIMLLAFIFSSNAYAEFIVWNPDQQSTSETTTIKFSADFEVPVARADGTIIRPHEVDEFCARVVMMDIDGGRSKRSARVCIPANELLPSWIVARNGAFDTRPVRYLRTLTHPNDGTVPDVRVPVGAPCYEDTRPGEQDGVRQWRLWREDGKSDGRALYQVYCEKQ